MDGTGLRALRALTPIATPKLVPGFVAHHALLGSFATPALRAALARALSHVSARTLAARLRDMADFDVRAELHALDRPALYLRGRRDRLVSARFGEEFLATARRGRIAEIEAPHLLLQARPRDAAEAILDFVREVGAGA